MPHAPDIIAGPGAHSHLMERELLATAAGRKESAVSNELKRLS